MLRWMLLGGRWGPFPWQLLLALGASVGVAGVLVLVLSLGTSLAWVSEIEAAGMGVVGAALLGMAAWRRARGPPPARPGRSWQPPPGL